MGIDFTKEELEIIHVDMIVYAKRWYPLKEAQSHQDLRDKIEAMIDDYCEHEFRLSNEAHFKCLSCGFREHT